MRQQARISLAANRLWVGSKLRVLIDGPSSESELILQGRASWQAPEVDGSILITDSGDLPLSSGEFYEAEITAGLDLRPGRPCIRARIGGRGCLMVPSESNCQADSGTA